MVDDKYIDLLHREEDGTLGYLERRRLQRYLRHHPEARELRRQIAAVGAALKQVDRLEPPAELRAGIMRRLTPWARVRPQRLRIRARVAELVGDFGRRRPVVPFAVGIAVGTLILMPVVLDHDQPGTMDIGRMTGALLQRPPDARPVDRRDFSLGYAEGSLDILAADGWVFADLAVNSGSEVELTLRYDNRDITIYGLANFGPTVVRFENTGRELRITHVGWQRYHLAFVDDPERESTLHLTIAAGGHIHEESLRTAGGN